MPEVQEALKENTPMVDLDTTGNAVDVEIKDSKADTKEVENKDEPIVEVREEKDEREEYSDERLEKKKTNAKNIAMVSKNVLTE